MHAEQVLLSTRVIFLITMLGSCAVAEHQGWEPPPPPCCHYPQGVKKMIFCKNVRIFKGFRMNLSRDRNSNFCFFVILGSSKPPDRAKEVDLPPGESIWKGVEVPGGG